MEYPEQIEITETAQYLGALLRYPFHYATNTLLIAENNYRTIYGLDTPLSEILRYTSDFVLQMQSNNSPYIELMPPFFWTEGIIVIHLKERDTDQNCFSSFEIGISALSAHDLMIFRAQRHRLDFDTRREAGIKKPEEYQRGERFYNWIRKRLHILPEAYSLLQFAHIIPPAFTHIYFPELQYQYRHALDRINRQPDIDDSTLSDRLAMLYKRANFRQLLRSLSFVEADFSAGNPELLFIATEKLRLASQHILRQRI
jgi:hypothetical protein